MFYQTSWDVVGESVVKFVLEFFESGLLPQATNNALVVLIPKIAKPERITQFRPISLCNVLFKTITKTMVERLKIVITKLIGPAQASFIPGHLRTANYAFSLPLGFHFFDSVPASLDSIYRDDALGIMFPRQVPM